jgi:ABC-2 type transport system permease protein
MRAFFIMLRRELAGYFFSPLAYVVLAFFLAVMGASFWMLSAYMTEGMRQLGIMRALFSESIFFWICLLMLVPIITMRAFPEERRSGTYELLMTAPVGDAAVVLAKYFGVLIFYLFLWLPTLAYIWILEYIGADGPPIDYGTLLSSYLGLVLIGASYIALGILCSALAKNAITAAMSSFALLFVFFLAGFVPYISTNETVQNLGSSFSSISHMIKLSLGIIDSRSLVFYLSLTAATLFATVRIVESRRWK